LADVVRSESRNYNVNDLNWGRLTVWREMLADLFDDPQRLPLLEHVTSVKIVYGAEDTYERIDRTRGPAAARAALLVGWLGSRLGWEPGERGWVVEGDHARAAIHDPARGGAEVQIDLESSVLPDSVPGGLVSLEITFDQAGQTAGSPSETGSVSIRRMGESCMCEARVERPGLEVAARTVDITPVPEDRLLAEELDQLGPDRVFEETLLLAATLLRLPGGDHLVSSAALDS
jgi:glucose-6-phosphate dehydrogenase assembly protein OpcA